MSLQFYSEVDQDDPARVRELVASTGFFRPDEIEVAVELVDTRLVQGLESGYFFWLARDCQGLAGYVCYGPIPCTIGSFDLYWIVVHQRCQGKGLGRRLTVLTENSVRTMGGRKLYVETAGKELYAPTQAFYRRAGFRLAATLPDFYETGDDKLIFEKCIDEQQEAGEKPHE